jgi:hypothetical protein
VVENRLPLRNIRVIPNDGEKSPTPCFPLPPIPLPILWLRLRFRGFGVFRG